MMTEYETKLIKLNHDLRGRKKGSKIRVKVDKEGTPLDPYWRRRLKDSKMDKCCEVLEKKRGKGVKNDSNT